MPDLAAVFMTMAPSVGARNPSALKILPAYTGMNSIGDALNDPRASRLVWLEILVNEELDIGAWQDNPEFQEAYHKACCWYTTYRTLLDALLVRTPLPSAHGQVDVREHRTFLEAIRFATANS